MLKLNRDALSVGSVRALAGLPGGHQSVRLLVCVNVVAARWVETCRYKAVDREQEEG